MRGEIADRPPVSLWRHFPVDDQTPEALAEAHLAFQSLYDFDLVKITPSSSYSVADWGIVDVWEGNTEGTRTYSRRVVHEPRDWAALEVLKPDAPHLASQLQCLRIVRSVLGSDTPVLLTVFNPLSQAKHLAGDGTLLEHLRTNPEMVRKGLDTIAQSTKLYISAVKAAGADGIFYAVQHAQAQLMSPAEFEAFSRADDIQLLRSAEDMWCNVLHVHGERVHFASICDYPASIVNWHDREFGPSMDQAGYMWGHSLCGGLSRSTLTFGSAQDVKDEADESMSGKHAARLLLSTGCVVPIIAPHGNLLAAASSAHLEAGGMQKRPS